MRKIATKAVDRESKEKRRKEFINVVLPRIDVKKCEKKKKKKIRKLNIDNVVPDQKRKEKIWTEM